MNYTAAAVTVVGLMLLLALLVATNDLPFIVRLAISIVGGALVGIPMERIRPKHDNDKGE